MYYRISNVNDKKKMIIAINDHGQSFYFKQTQLVVYKFDTICKGIQKGIHFFIFNLKTSKLSNRLSSNGPKSQIFGPRKDSDLVPC